MSSRPSRLHFGLAIASLAVSLLLWLHVKSEAALRYSLNYEFVLRHTGLDESRYIIKNIPTKVPVQVEGNAEQHERFKALRPASLIATIDLSDARPELSSYRLRLARSEAIDRTGVSLNLVADEVAVVIDEVVEREMEVSVDPYNVPPGLMFSSAEVKPDKIRVRGPMGDIVKLTQVRALVDVSRAIGRGIPVRLDPLDRNERPLESVTCIPTEVTVFPQLAKVPPTKNVVVSATLAEGTVPAPGYRLTDLSVNPPTIKVNGDINALASLRAIETVPVRLDGLSAPAVLKVRLAVPKGLTVDRATVDVRVRIEPIPTISAPPPQADPKGSGNGGQP